MRASGILVAFTLLGSPCGLFAQAPASALAEIAASEAARVRGDSNAWARVAPTFIFVHGTGSIDDLARFRAFLARGAAATARTAGRRRDMESPTVRIDGDVLVRVRSLADTALDGIRPGESRALDVYVRHDGEWRWLAHQTSEVRSRWTITAALAADLQDFAGTYLGPDGRLRTYAVRGDTLVQRIDGISGGNAPSERRMIPLSEASFGYDGLNATVTFVRDRSGRVIGADEASAVAFVHYVRRAR